MGWNELEWNVWLVMLTFFKSDRIFNRIGMGWNELEWVGMSCNDIKGDFDRKINRI